MTMAPGTQRGQYWSGFVEDLNTFGDQLEKPTASQT
uniref:Uncharacterized protein n=1 Tax=Anguilla anguilla TaxID=7936 RepID=A0A0E9V2M9_ANGAN